MAALVAAGTASAQITVGTNSTLGDWSNYNTLPQGTNLHAQVIQTPDSSNVLLNSFTFYLTSFGYPSVNFNAVVAEWNVGSSQLTGAPLWMSPTMSVLASDNFSAFNFAPSIALDPVKSYALFVLPVYGPNSMFGLAAANSGVYGNTFGFTSNGVGMADYNALAAAGSWTDVSGGYDMTYSATFSTVSPVPEPTVPGFAVGMAGMVAWAAYRRRKSVTAAVTA